MAIVRVNWKPDARQLRWFALTGTVVFCAAIVTATVTGKLANPRWIAWLWAGIGVWTLLAIVRPGLLRPVYLAVTAVSLPIGVVVSYLILAVVYFGIFTPIAFAFRLFGRDALHRRFDPDEKTYWTPRRPADDVRRYFRQF